MRKFEQFYTTDTFYDVNTKIWHGPEIAHLYGPQDSIGDIALRVLLKKPEKIAQICINNGKEYTNLEIVKWSMNVAENFKKLNLQQCDIIGICAANTDYLAPLFFGAMLAGLTVSPLDPSFDKDGIKHIYSITKPKLMFCDGGVYDKVQESLKELQFNIPIYTMKDHREGVGKIDDFLKENVDVKSYSAEPLKFGSNQVAAILCSSGTTGKPKAVCMSHCGLLNNDLMIVDATGSLLNFSTLYWLSGLLALVSGTVRGGIRIISDRPFSADDFLEAVQKYKVTNVCTPPSAMGAIIASPKLKQYDLSSIVAYLCGGSAVPYSLVEKLLSHLPNAMIIAGYGMSEICACVATAQVLPDNSTGKILPNFSVKIIDDDGQQLGPKEVGEICIKKKLSPWAGYYGNEAATEQTYKDGWLLSGDLGYFDETGKLFVIDRKKDIYKYNNFQFYPTEIEDVINRLTGVKEVCVCGIPDIVLGFLPAAAIVRTAKDSTLTEQDVYDYVAKNMVHFKHLRGGVYFLESLPKTASGKIIRRKATNILVKLRSEQASKR